MTNPSDSYTGEPTASTSPTSPTEIQKNDSDMTAPPSATYPLPLHLPAKKPDILKASYNYGTSLRSVDPHFVTRHPCKTYLFGHPIKHSLAPLLHNTLYDNLSVPWTFILHDSTDPNTFFPLLHSHNCVGAAITMPYKVSFIEHVDALTDEARTIGAMNTVFVRLDKDGKRRYIGTNTDCYGVRDAFRANFQGLEFTAKGRTAAVIGGGGASRAAVYALGRWFGVKEILLVNRDQAEVQAVVDGFKKAGFETPLRYVGTVEEAKKCDTPVMMVGCVPDHPPSTDAEKMARAIVTDFLERSEKGVVLEMCYHPAPRTEFYGLAEDRGWKVMPGTEMMIYQGIAQQILWTEREELGDVSKVIKVIRKEVEKRVHDGMKKSWPVTTAMTDEM